IHTMTNFNGNFNSVYNNPLPLEYAHWSLDSYVDDDEFRDGYPFSDISEVESNKSCGSHDNDIVQSDMCITTTKEKNQLTELSTKQQVRN
ncbi:unnamed protein product, partial [Rotaria sordida]